MRITKVVENLRQLDLMEDKSEENLPIWWKFVLFVITWEIVLRQRNKISAHYKLNLARCARHLKKSS